MEPLEQLAKVSEGVTDLHTSFVEQIAGVQDEGMRQYMTSLAARLQELHGEVMQSFPNAYAALQSQVAATRKRNAEVMQKVEVLKAKQAEARARAEAAATARAEESAKVAADFKAQAEAVNAKPKEPVIPLLSAQMSDALRDELLARFGLREAPRRNSAEFQDAGEDWHRSTPIDQSVAIPGQSLAR